MPYEPWSLEDLARHLTAVEGTQRRYKMVLEFVRGYVEATADVRVGLLTSEPPLVGDPRWDGLIAGLADHYAFHDRLPQPAWTGSPQRICFPPFAPVDTPGVRTMARVHSPAGFLRHGVLIMPEDLQPV